MESPAGRSEETVSASAEGAPSGAPAPAPPAGDAPAFDLPTPPQPSGPAPSPFSPAPGPFGKSVSPAVPPVVMPPRRAPRPRRRRPAAGPFKRAPVRLTPIDGSLLRSLGGFELALILRGHGWGRLLAASAAPAFLLAVLPLLWLGREGDLRAPIGREWTWSIGVALQALYFCIPLAVMRRRLRHELQPGRVEEIVVTGAGMREVFLGKALAITLTGMLLALTSLPGLSLLLGPSGHDLLTGLRLLAVLMPAALLGAAVGLEAVLPRGAVSYSQAFWLFLAMLFALLILSAVPAPGWLAGQGVRPDVVAVLTALHAAATAVARFLLNVLYVLNPLAALFDAWDPAGGHWPARCATLWALVAAVWWRNSRYFDARDVPALGQARRLLQFRLVEFDPRPHRRWRVGPLGSVQDLAFGAPPDEVPLSVSDNRPAPDFSRGNPVAAFDALFGSRVYIRADYLTLLYLTVVFAPLAFVLFFGLLGAYGSPWGSDGWLTRHVYPAVAFQAVFLSFRMCFGMAASMVADREKGRWPFLCLTPLTDREILLGKVAAVIAADRKPFILAAAYPILSTLLLVTPPGHGILLLAMVTALPVACAFIGGLLALTAVSQAEALFRCSLALFGPPATIVLLAAVGLRDGWYHLAGPFAALIGLAASPESPRWVAAAWGSVGLWAGAGALSALLTARLLRSRLGAAFGQT